MRPLLVSLYASAALLAASAAHASDADNVYYSGRFSCHSENYITDWKISKDLTGKIKTTVYYQVENNNYVRWIDMVETSTADGNVLADEKGNPRLAVAAEGRTIRAAWLKGAPGRDCQQFTVTRAETPRERFDALFTALETPAPDAAAVARVEDLSKQVPIEFTLPQLDRQAYMKRYREGMSSFWKRYQDKVVGDLSALPVATPADRKVFAETLNTTFSDNLAALTRNDDYLSAALKLLSASADRMVVAGGQPASDLYQGDATEMCSRFTALQGVNEGFNLDKLELATSVPFDYWTRDIAERYLAAAPACPAMPESYSQQLVSQWPKIQERQELIGALRKEQQRLAAMPANAATLIETGNLKPNLKGISTGWGQSDLVARFVEQPLEKRRTEVFDGAVAEIDTIAAAYTPDQPETGKKLDEVCSGLRGLYSLPNDRTKTIRDRCETALEGVATKQSAAAVEKIEAAFVNVEPDTPEAEKALELCQTLPSDMRRNAAMPVYQLCQTKQNVLQKRAADLRCNAALTASGADDDLLDSTILVSKLEGDGNVKVRDLVCRVSERNTRITFETSGVLLWKTQKMLLHHPRDEKKPGELVLAPLEDGKADWAITVEDPETKADMEKEGVTADKVSACMTGASGCTR